MQNSTAIMVQFLVFMFCIIAFFAVLEVRSRHRKDCAARRKEASRRGATRG